jgi:hypothetical protein
MLPCPGRPFAGRADPGPVGETPRMTSCHPFGRAEPAPPRDSWFELGWPSGERPERTRSAVFSEGRGLRARTVRPDEWQGIALPPVVLRQAGGRSEATFGFGVMPPSRACGARPSATRPSRWETGLGSRPQDFAKGPFLGGTHSVRPHGKAPRMPRHSILTRR